MSNSKINKEMVLALPAQKTVEEVKKYVCYHCPIFSKTKKQDLKAKEALPLGARFNNVVGDYDYLAMFDGNNKTGYSIKDLYKCDCICVVNLKDDNIVDTNLNEPVYGEVKKALDNKDGRYKRINDKIGELTQDQKQYIKEKLKETEGNSLVFVFLKHCEEYSSPRKVYFGGTSKGNGITSAMKYLKADLDKFTDQPILSQGQKNKSPNKDSISTKISNSGSKSNSMQTIIPLNQILFGPPGTGKTYNTVNMALDIVCPLAGGLKWKTKSREEARIKYQKMLKGGQIVFVTFHQSMSYEDFIEGIKPKTEDGKITYEVKDGIFKKLCEKAKDNNTQITQNYVMIIDEINRGNVANIFGELISLIEDDKRLGASEELCAELPYSHDIFSVPKNVYIIGTMNTADRSVEALDSALRRRFTFKEMMPKSELVPKENNVRSIFEIINQRIEVLKDREHQIGHSYFMGVNSEEGLKAVIYDKIIPLLQEYFYGDYEKIQLVLGEGFVKKDSASVKFAGDKSGDFEVSEVYRIVPKDECNMDEAIGKLLNKNKASEAVEE